MIGVESEELERLRAQKKSQYASELRKQIEEQNKNSQLRTSAAQQIIGKPKRQLDYLNRNTQGGMENDYNRNSPPTYQEHEQYSPRRYNQQQPQQQYHQPTMQYQQPSMQMQNVHESNVNYQEIQYKFDRIINYEIPSRIKPCEEQLASLNTKIDRQLTANTDMVLSMRDKFQEMQMNLNSLMQRVADNSDRLRATAQDFSAENQKLREQISSTMLKVQQFDGVIRQIDESIKGIAQRQQLLEQSVSDSFVQINEVMANVQKSSESSDQHIMQQVESLSKQTIATFGQANQNIQALSDSITTLSNDVRQSFSVVRSEMDASIDDISKKAEQVSTESAAAFQTMQDEVIQTFTSLHSLIDSTTKTFEEALQNEVNTRQSEQQHLLDANDIFTQAITTQMTSLAKAIDATNTNMKESIDTNCQDFLNQWKGDLGQFIKDSATNIADCQTRMKQVETSLANYVVSVGQRQDEIVELIRKAKVRPQFDDTELRKRIEKLEKEIEKRPPSSTSNKSLPETITVTDIALNGTKQATKPIVRPYIRMPESNNETQRPQLTAPKTEETATVRQPTAETEQTKKREKRKKKEIKDEQKIEPKNEPKDAPAINDTVKEEVGETEDHDETTEEKSITNTQNETAKEHRRVKKRRRVTKDETSEDKPKVEEKAEEEETNNNIEEDEKSEVIVPQPPKEKPISRPTSNKNPVKKENKKGESGKPEIKEENESSKIKEDQPKKPDNPSNAAANKPEELMDINFFRPAESLAEVNFLELTNLK